MKITHVFHHFAPCTGGIETVILQLSKETKAKHWPNVVCLNKCPKGRKTLPDQSTEQGIKVSRIPFINLGFYKFAPAVAKKIRETDILHVHGVNFFSDFLALTKILHRKPMVLSTHGGIFHTGRGLFKRLYFFGWCKLTLRAFEKIVCVSRNDLELFSRIASKEKLVLIENGIEFEKFRAGKKKKNSFVFLGRMSKNKRIDLLIDALAGLQGKPELHIAGMDFDNLAPVLKARAKEKGIEGQVFIHGEVSDRKLLDLLAQSEFFVSASEYEGFGITAIEAMASGCIPILNNIGSFRSFVQEKKNGFIVDFAETKKTGEKIGKITMLGQAEKNSIRKNAIAKAKSFSWKSRANEFYRVYEGAME